MDTTLVACLDKKTDIGVHEGDGHGNIRAIGKDIFRVKSELLDERENVIPSSTVKSRGVITEFIDDFVHFVSSQDGFDQDSATDSTTGNVKHILGNVENVVPESGFEMGFHLGKIEVRTESVLDKLVSIVVEIETKVKDRARHRLTINQDMLLFQVPSTGSKRN
jgi:ElaB/YqjD/DUF883 family membrane-anchored ribosome-binding protein